jgi:WD40 repeat protein
LWSVEEPGVLRQWDPNTRQQLSFHPLDEVATVWAFSPAARRVAAGSDELTVWEVRHAHLQAVWPQGSWVTAVAFPAATGIPGDWLATGHDDGSVRLWDVATERVLREFRSSLQAVSAAPRALAWQRPPRTK